MKVSTQSIRRVQSVKKLFVNEERLKRSPFPGFYTVLRWWVWEGAPNSHAAVLEVYDVNDLICLSEWFPSKCQARDRTFDIQEDELWPRPYKY